MQPVPDAWHYQQSLIGPVERVGELHFAIIDGNVKTTADGDDELLADIMAVPSSFSSTGHIVDIERALNIKRQFLAIVHCREVAVGMMVPVQADDAAVIEARMAMVRQSIHLIVRFHALVS